MRGIAWATSRELIDGSWEFVPVVVAGRSVLAHYYGQWFLVEHGTAGGADAEARELTAVLESCGAGLSVGPVEFDVPDPAPAGSAAEAVLICATQALHLAMPMGTRDVERAPAAVLAHHARLSPVITPQPRHPMIPGA